ncbi:MAG: OmpA family protein [Marinibacterium sp.]|nr:OmpA family protein [Marinibacterium sp.]
MIKKTWIAALGLCGAMVAGGASAQVSQAACTLSVFFPNGISSITAAQSAAVENFVRGAVDPTVVVRGYASEAGAAEANLALSQRRAQTVANAARGSGSSVTAAGEGVAGPGAQARRVEVYRDGCAAPFLDPSVAGALPEVLAGGSVAGNAVAGVAALVVIGAALGNNGTSSTATD